MLAVGTGIWAYLKLRSFFDEHEETLGQYDVRTKPPKVEIQTLFHGNTKDQDQI